MYFATSVAVLAIFGSIAGASPISKDSLTLVARGEGESPRGIEPARDEEAKREEVPNIFGYVYKRDEEAKREEVPNIFGYVYKRDGDQKK